MLLFKIASGQTTTVYCNFTAGSIDLVDPVTSAFLNANTLTNAPFLAEFYATNNGPEDAPPANFQVVLSLGSKLMLDPSFDLATASGSNYVTWTYSPTTLQIIGRPYIGAASLPDGVGIFCSFKLVSNNILGTSSLQAKININNDPASSSPISDIFPGDNGVLLSYGVVTILNNNTTTLTASKLDCNSFAANWSTGNEDNVAKYELQTSANGVEFATTADALPTGNSIANNYRKSITLPNNLANVFLRLKTIAINGTIKYSSIIRLALCDKVSEAWVIKVAPNPVMPNAPFKIVNVNGLFNSDLQIQILNSKGQVLQTHRKAATNLSNIEILPRYLSAGSYFIRALNLTTKQVVSLPLIVGN